MINSYTQGEQVRFSGSVAANGTAVDPTNVYFAVKRGDGSAPTIYHYGVDSQLVKDSAGHYHVDMVLTVAGTWRYAFYSPSADAYPADAFQVIEVTGNSLYTP